MNLDRDGLRLALTPLLDSEDALFIPQFLVLLDGPGDITAFDHFDPGHVTASGFVVSPAGDSFALVHHRKLERWLQPGGHLEPHDVDLESAARREIEEETGLRQMDSMGLFDIDIHTFPGRADVPEHLHFDVRFAFRSQAGKLAALDGVTDAQWVGFGELEVFDVDVSVRRPAAKLEQMLRILG